MSADEAPHPNCPYNGPLVNHRFDEVVEKVDGINARLDRLNGKVADHESRLVKIETRIAVYMAMAVPLTGGLMWVADKLWK